MRRKLAFFLVAVGMLTGVANGEISLVGKAVRDSFVRCQSDHAGAWVVIGPNALTVTPTAQVGPVTLGEASVNVREVLPIEKDEDGDGNPDVFQCVWVGPPGVYVVLQFADGKYEHVVVSIPGTPDPKPGPNPKPGPDPTPGVVKRLVIVRETATTTPVMATILNTIRQKVPNNLPLLIVDKDSQQPAVRQFIEAARGKALPVVCLVDDDGKVVRSASFATLAEFLRVVK